MKLLYGIIFLFGVSQYAIATPLETLRMGGSCSAFVNALSKEWEVQESRYTYGNHFRRCLRAGGGDDGEEGGSMAVGQP